MITGASLPSLTARPWVRLLTNFRLFSDHFPSVLRLILTRRELWYAGAAQHEGSPRNDPARENFVQHQVCLHRIDGIFIAIDGIFIDFPLTFY